MRWKKIILCEGGIETLDFFLTEMGKEFERQGMQVFYYDLSGEERNLRALRKFIKPRETIFLTYNFEGLSREEGIYQEDMGYLWAEYQLPIYHVIVDAPYCYHNRFVDWKEDADRQPALLQQFHHFSIDQAHETYVKKYYPWMPTGGLLPLAGTGIFQREEWLPWKERSRRLIFTGNYTELAFFDHYFKSINSEYEAFYRGIAEDLIANPWQEIYEVEERHIVEATRETAYENTLENMAAAMHRMMFIDMYVRNYMRGKVVQAIVEAGQKITVIGKGWEKLPLKKNRDCLDQIPQTNSFRCLEEIARSKYSLNVMPWFKEGYHDRVFNSILNGAYALSDPSSSLKKEFSDGKGISFFELTKIEEIEDLLPKLESREENPEFLEGMDEAYEFCQKKHCWANRAQELMKIWETEK